MMLPKILSLFQVLILILVLVLVLVIFINLRAFEDPQCARFGISRYATSDFLQRFELQAPEASGTIRAHVISNGH